MELKTFKKTTGDFLIAKGFLKKGSFYYLTFQDLIIVIGFQKSNFSNSYYINIGYIIREINPNLLTPRDVDGDIRARFSIEMRDKKIDYFDLNILTEVELKNAIDENIKRYVENISSLKEIRTLLQKNPVMLYQTKLTVKNLLSLEE